MCRHHQLQVDGSRKCDFDGDDNNDLIFQHTDAMLAACFFNGTKLTSATLLNPSNPGRAQWRIVSAVDGSLNLWLMDGINRTAVQQLNPSKPGGTWKVVAPK